MRPGEIYRHYGNKKLYTVLHIAIDHATENRVVVYVSNDSGTIWVREYEEFLEEVEHNNVHRFERIIN